MDKLYILLFLVMILFVPGSLLAHGVDLLVIEGGSGIEARYDSGQPISDAEVEVYSPADPDTIFQAGSTDKNGRFLFFPDSDGEWKIKINDGMGHGGTRSIIIKDSEIVVNAEGENPPGRSIKILSGLSVIFGITGILFFFLARREARRKRNAHS